MVVHHGGWMNLLMRLYLNKENSFIMGRACLTRLLDANNLMHGWKWSKQQLELFNQGGQPQIFKCYFKDLSEPFCGFSQSNPSFRQISTRVLKRYILFCLLKIENVTLYAVIYGWTRGCLSRQKSREGENYVNDFSNGFTQVTRPCRGHIVRAWNSSIFLFPDKYHRGF